MCRIVWISPIFPTQKSYPNISLGAFMKARWRKLKEKLKEALGVTWHSDSLGSSEPFHWKVYHPLLPAPLVAEQRAGQKRVSILIWNLKFGQQENRITTGKQDDNPHQHLSPAGQLWRDSGLTWLFIDPTCQSYHFPSPADPDVALLKLSDFFLSVCCLLLVRTLT